MFSAKQGKYWYHRLWFDAVLGWGLSLAFPALQVSNLPLGCRGGGYIKHQCLGQDI